MNDKKCIVKEIECENESRTVACLVIAVFILSATVMLLGLKLSEYKNICV